MGVSDRQTALGPLTASQPAPKRQSPADEPTDAALMRRVVDRDRSALGCLYDRYSRYVYAACLRVLGSPADAEDTMIQVFTEVWERPKQFDAGRGDLSTYLMILARSRATDLRRSQARRKGLIAGAADRLASTTVDDATPAEAVYLRERREHIQQALQGLGPNQRKAVELAFLEGLSHRQIAERLGTPVGTVKTRIRLGLIQLRSSLRILMERQ